MFTISTIYTTLMPAPVHTHIHTPVVMLAARKSRTMFSSSPGHMPSLRTTIMDRLHHRQLTCKVLQVLQLSRTQGQSLETALVVHIEHEVRPLLLREETSAGLIQNADDTEVTYFRV